MDVFSATSKQVEAATTPKVANTTQTRPVEQSNETSKVKDGNEQSKDLNQTVNELNEQMDLLETNVAFGFNDKIDMMFVNVMEKSSGKTIRKIPTEEAMDLSEKMKEIVGMIFDKKG